MSAPGDAGAGLSVLQRVAAGEPGAAQACLDAFGSLVWSVVRRVMGASADAEDTVQEVFIEVWRHAGRYDPAKGNETQFVATIARRRTIDRVRRRARRPATEPIHENVGGEAPDASLGAERDEQVARAQAALEQLPEQRQQVLRMAVLAGATHTEIAERTGLPLGTVKTHVRRGLIRLRELLAEPGDGPEGAA